MSNFSYSTVTIADTATEVFGGRPNRRGWIMYNAGTAAIYYGPDASITTSNALCLAQGATILSSDMVNWKGAVYGIVATGTQDLRFFEWGE